MKAKDLKKKYFEFFKKKQHKLIRYASLVPENDPSVLFTTAGMHPLVPFLMGEPHPLGKRLVNVQKCLRTGAIDEVGDPHHLTFFEMLGNWSLGDYFKDEAIAWSFEFLTSKKWLGLDKKRISVTCFEGDKNSPKDIASEKAWLKQGIPKERIFFLSKEDNWWGPAGTIGPCGPCTEMYYDTLKPKCSKNCQPGCQCGKYFEIWNDVFMEYHKENDGSFTKLDQRNVDTGMGVERTAAMLQGKDNVYEIETFKNIIEKIKDLSDIPSPNASQINSMRIIADHLRSSVFMLGDEYGIKPSNVDQGYVLRRLIRKSIRHGKLLNIHDNFCSEIAEIIIKNHKEDYTELNKNKKTIINELKTEEEKFEKTLKSGLKEFQKMSKNGISGKEAFLLFQSYGFPIEMTQDLAKEKDLKVDVKGFQEEFKKHQALSRESTKGKFKGGLGDHSEETIKLHTANHLLNEAIRVVLKDKNVVQKGSNITSKRLRFDFNFDRKLTEEEIRKIEDLVNKKIKEALPVKKEEMTLDEAKEKAAQGVFEHKYADKVSVYSVGDFSIEICGGPHVKNTKELGHFKIIKEESSSAGIRRIKAVLN